MRTAPNSPPALGIGAFAEKTLVAAGQCTKVDPEADPAAVGLLGCGVMAASARPSTPATSTAATPSPSSAAAESATRPSPAPRWPAPTTIIAVDIDTGSSTGPRTSAPPTPSTPPTVDPVEAIRELTGGYGADVVIDAVGRPETYKQAFYARDLAGTVVLVGVPTPEMTLELPLLDVFGRGGSLKSSWYGDCLPARDFPMLIDLYLQGRLDLDAFVTETIALDDDRGGLRQDARGDVLRSVVVL